MASLMRAIHGLPWAIRSLIVYWCQLLFDFQNLISDVLKLLQITNID